MPEGSRTEGQDISKIGYQKKTQQKHYILKKNDLDLKFPFHTNI